MERTSPSLPELRAEALFLCNRFRLSSWMDRTLATWKVRELGKWEISNHIDLSHEDVQILADPAAFRTLSLKPSWKMLSNRQQ